MIRHARQLLPVELDFAGFNRLWGSQDSAADAHVGLRNFPSNGKNAIVRTLSLKGAKALLRKFARAIVVA